MPEQPCEDATTPSGRPQRFAFGMLASGLFTIFATNLIDPDGLIVCTNLSKPNADFAYMATLSDDAVLAMSNVPAAYRIEANEPLRARRSPSERRDWREMNLSLWLLSR